MKYSMKEMIGCLLVAAIMSAWNAYGDGSYRTIPRESQKAFPGDNFDARSLPGDQFEPQKKQPPPPGQRKQIRGTINPGTIRDIGGKTTCTGDTPGCRPPETPGGGPTPPKCGEVGPNVPCW